MAIFSLGEIGLTDIRGRIGGSQFTRNGAGHQVILPTIPRQPKSAGQLGNNYQLQQVLAEWKTLTSGEYDSWVTAAALPEWARTNRVGESYQPSPQSLFIQLNLSAFKQAFPMREPSAWEALSDSPVTGAVITPGVDFVVSTSITNILGNEWVLYFTTAGTSPGRLSTQQPRWRFTASYDYTEYSTNQDILTEYVTTWGEPIPGRRIFVKVICLNGRTGGRLEWGTVSAVVPT